MKMRMLVAIPLLVLLILPSIYSFATTTGAVHVTNAYNYQSSATGYYIKWATDMYMDSLTYGISSDSHINFTNMAFGSADNTTTNTFGVVSWNTNATILSSCYSPTEVCFLLSTISANGTAYLTYYFIGSTPSTQIIQATPTTIPPSDYYSSYSSWASSTAPSVYQAGNTLYVKTTYPNAQINFIPVTTTLTSTITLTSTFTTTITSGTSTITEATFTSTSTTSQTAIITITVISVTTTTQATTSTITITSTVIKQ